MKSPHAPILGGKLLRRRDIAKIAGVRPETVQEWIDGNLGFPAPVGRVHPDGTLWLRSEVERWLRETGRI